MTDHIDEEQQIKSAMESGAQLHGPRMATGEMEKMIEGQFKMVFRKMNQRALMILITEIQQQPDDYWNNPPELYDD